MFKAFVGAVNYFWGFLEEEFSNTRSTCLLVSKEVTESTEAVGNSFIRAHGLSRIRVSDVELEAVDHVIETSRSWRKGMQVSPWHCAQVKGTDKL